jgi:hypothetical protein
MLRMETSPSVPGGRTPCAAPSRTVAKVQQFSSKFKCISKSGLYFAALNSHPSRQAILVLSIAAKIGNKTMDVEQMDAFTPDSPPPAISFKAILWQAH